ncbi:hypothetical protein DRE_04478 [Drechslerella stenobrocha 248]|uniref:Nuclear protein DGCR14 n=1 Tax=Drechslerella stenobrocha 248 TaxID=1043628 RepID=W7I1A6_9PEZI|nr:hypothetical protein DRE_04478 [Drechslerella stenobrocha 248]
MADYAAPPPSQALIRKSTDTELMPPPPAKRIKRPPKVLDEDSYTTAISDIIARDFFPGLAQARHQEEYLDALASKDQEWIASAGRKLTEAMTGPRLRNRRSTPSFRSSSVAATPSARGFDTPMSVRDDISVGTATSNRMERNYDDKLSLDGFQTKYTSEDNASFNNLLDNQNQKHREDYGWLWRGNKISKPSVIAERERQKLLKEKEEREGVEKTKLLKYQDDKPAMPETWKVNPRNTLMFSPHNLDDEMLDLDLNPATNTESRAAPKSISHTNTRMPPPRAAAYSVPPSPSVSAIRDAIAGNPRFSASEAPSVAGGSATPRVNGYSFVDDAPSPSPSELGLPPMTWGTIDDLLPSVEASPSPFKIGETSRREKTLHRMVDKVAKSKRASAKMTVPGTPDGSTAGTPIATARRMRTIGSMTPAARGLLGKIGTGRTDSVFGGTGGGDKKEARYKWTPTPRADRKGDATPLIKRK